MGGSLDHLKAGAKNVLFTISFLPSLAKSDRFPYPAGMPLRFIGNRMAATFWTLDDDQKPDPGLRDKLKV